MIMKMILIAPKFYGYENKIINKMKEIGIEVTFIPENIVEYDFKYKLFNSLLKNKEEIINKYYIDCLKKCDNDCDIIFIIRGYYISASVFHYIKKKYPNIKICTYQWDSVKNNPNALIVAQYGDRNSTFDPMDAKKYNWNYRPLFYFETTNSNKNRIYDLAFISSLHSQRIKIFNKLKSYREYKKFLYMYSHAVNYYKQKYLYKNNDYIECTDKDIKFISLSVEKANKVMSESRVIIDYTHPNQTGLTMRTCESIGHRCKLITNNSYVKNMDFYNPNNIFVFDQDNFSIPSYFMNSKYQDIDKEIFYKYSIECWIKEIIGIDSERK